MSKETIKMRTLRLERVSLKKSLAESEAKVRTQRNIIRESWKYIDEEDEAFKTIKKCGRIIKCEKERQKVFSGLLRATKYAIRKLNRQHDMRNNAVNYYILHQMKVEE